MKKLLFLIPIILFSLKVKAQFFVNIDTDTSYYRQWMFMPNPIVDRFKSDQFHILYAKSVIFPNLLDSAGTSIDRIVYALPNGTLRFSNVGNLRKATNTQSGIVTSSDWNLFNNKQNSLVLTTNGTGIATFVNDTLNIPNPTTPNFYSAGEGIKITGTAPNQTIAVDTSVASSGNNAIMYVGKANGAIAGLNSAINTKQSILISGTNIKTINGNSLLGPGDLVISTSITPTFNNNVSRSLNSNYTISTTKYSQVNYSINISWSIAALLSGSGTAFLEYSTNSGSSWTTVNQVSKSIGLLTFAGADDLNLSGLVPANSLIRIRTSSNNMTITYVRGQEVLF